VHKCFFFFLNGENGVVGYGCVTKDTLGGLSDTF